VTESTSDVKEVVKPQADTPSWLRDRLLHECEVMATHALSFGMQVPEPVVRALALALAPGIPGKATAPATADDNVPVGRSQPGDSTLQQDWPDDRLRQLAFAHNSLVVLIAPATPRTIEYLGHHLQRPGFLGFLGKVPFIRRAMCAAILFLLGFILIRILPHVNALLAAGDPASVSGWPLLLEELYYITAAGMGASFTVLFEVNQHTRKAAFDPIYEPFYWTRFALGLIAGVLLAELVPADTSKSIYHTVTKPTLALLGGFSASVVYRLLIHLRNTIESFIQPGTSDALDPQGQPVREGRAQTAAPDHLTVAGLLDLQRRLAAGTPPAHLQADVARLLAQLIPTQR
jgi:hypothetical protein